MKFSVEIGREFLIDDVKLLSAQTGYETSRTRNTVTVVLTFAIVGAFLVAAGIGVADGSMDEVKAVWSVVSFPLGLIMREYYGKGSRRRRYPGTNDATGSD